MSNLSYDSWKRLVDRSLVKKCGMNSEEIPDFDYFGYYDSGVSPTETADDAIENAKECF